MITDTDNRLHNSAVANEFTAVAERYSSHFEPSATGTHYNLRKRLELVTELTTECGGVLLDCAAGPGEITAAVLRSGRFRQASVVDISPTMIAMADRRLRDSLPTDVAGDVTCVNADVFDFVNGIHARQFDLVLCLGLIAHTGRLDELLSDLASVLSVHGKILLQSSLLDHWGTGIVRRFSARRYERMHGYSLSYFSDKDIRCACSAAGLRIASTRRFCAGIPFGDKIWPRANFHLETWLAPLSARFGSEALYLLERSDAC